MVHYPLKFQVHSHAKNGVNENWICHPEASHRVSDIRCAIPPEFNGPGGGYSPEDLFALSLVNCFIATFKVIADTSNLEYSRIRCDALLTVDRNESGQPWMDECNFHFVLEGATNKDKAERLLNKTAEQCLIWNSVHTKKTVRFTVSDSSVKVPGLPRETPVVMSNDGMSS